MSVTESRLWQQPRTALNILRHFPEQECDSVFRNDRIFFTSEDGRTAAYCVLADRGEFEQLMDVYTYPSFRGKGHAGQVISGATRTTEKSVLLMCEEKLQPFYKRYGFSDCKDVPQYMRERVGRVNGLRDD